MNKAKTMQKKLIKLAVIVAGILAVSGGIMMVTGSLATKATERKSAAESARNSDSSQVSTMRSQIEQSGDAEKRFVEIALNHSSNDYSADTDVLKAWLRDMTERDRFSDDFTLKLANGKPSDKPEFTNLNYEVTVRQPMQLEFGAISDMHVYSFVRQLEQDVPGMVRVTKLDVKRKTDLTASSFRDIASGAGTGNVEAAIEFTWIGISPKETKNNAAGAAPAAPGAGMGMPGGM